MLRTLSVLVGVKILESGLTSTVTGVALLALEERVAGGASAAGLAAAPLAPLPAPADTSVLLLFFGTLRAITARLV